MELLLGEHGEAILYGIVGIAMVIVICWICENQWKNIMPEYKNTTSKSSSGFLEENKGKFPVIDADEVIFAEYGDEKFNYKDFIVARDCNGKDITEDIRVYGSVNVFRKGLYKLRCVVVSQNSLTCTKYLNVIVE